MGIRYLNKYIRRNCSADIRKTCLGELSGSKVVVDASIYMYRFKSDECLIDGIYQMAMQMRKSGVTPVFVFDGKPPQEKMPLLKHRRDEKKRAELEMVSMQQKSKDNGGVHVNYGDYIECKRKCVRLRKSEIERVKHLLTLCGVTWYQAEGEADELCARLVIKKRAWACMSEDMDMFVYGCPRVLRCFDLYQGTCLLYDTNAILKSLGRTMREFREICVVSGSDYNVGPQDNLSLHDVITRFDEFKSDKKKVEDFEKRTTHENFYDWLGETGDYKSNIYQLYVADLVFDTSTTSLTRYDTNPIANQEIQHAELKTFLWQYNFVFP